MKQLLALLILMTMTQPACSKTAAPSPQGIVRAGADHPQIRYTGRVDRSDPRRAVFAWPGTSISIAFRGTSCSALLTGPKNWFLVLVDGKERRVIDLESSTDSLHVLAEDLLQGEHVVTLVKRTEAEVGEAVFSGFVVDGEIVPLAPPPARRIEFIGNSITCGYGNLDSVKENGFKPSTEDHWRSYAALTARALGAEHHAIAWSGRGILQNYDRATPETMAHLWERTLPRDPASAWNPAGWAPDVVVIDLGTNDYAHFPPPDSAAFENAMISLIRRIRARYGDPRFVLVDGPMISDGWPLDPKGKPVATLTRIRQHNRSIAARCAAEDIARVATFSLTPSRPEIGYGADWHPNLRQHEINAEDLTVYLSGVLGWARVDGKIGSAKAAATSSGTANAAAKPTNAPSPR